MKVRTFQQKPSELCNSLLIKRSPANCLVDLVMIASATNSARFPVTTYLPFQVMQITELSAAVLSSNKNVNRSMNLETRVETATCALFMIVRPMLSEKYVSTFICTKQRGPKTAHLRDCCWGCYDIIGFAFTGGLGVNSTQEHGVIGMLLKSVLCDVDMPVCVQVFF